ncbi:hypothetical protein OG524_10050 [Streptomyces sp. NBC_01520]|uniref:hypothetical protein n=1 Tax=Streptomyces sp. NBC_01520 TaxID=2903892 RepID=UPI003866CEA0
MPPAPEPVSKPDCLTEEQWARLTLAVLVGVAEGTDQAGLPWASDLGVTAVSAVRTRIDELWAAEGASDG